MTVKNRIQLKDKFQNGDKPTQTEFYDLIDSFFHKTEDFISANENATDVTNFNNNLSAADDTTQKALETLDALVIPTSLPATNITLDVTNFDNNLSVTDDTVQKAFETLDAIVAAGNPNWGNIQGNVTNQTDLNVILNNKFEVSNSTLLQVKGNYLTTAAQSNHSHSVVVQGNILATQGSGTFTLSVPSQTVQTQGSVLIQGKSGALSFVVGSSLSSSTNGNSTTFGLASNITSVLQSAGNYLTTAAQSNHSHSVVVQGNLLATQGNGTYTLSVPTQTVQTQGSVIVNGNSGALSLAVGSSLSSSVNGLSTTFGLASNVTTALQSAGAYLTTAAQSNHSHGFSGTNVSGTFNSNGLALSVDPSGGTQTVQAQTWNAIGNTAASNSTSGAGASMYIQGGNNITVGITSNSILISGANAGGAQTGISSLGNSQTTFTSGAVQFLGSNAVTVRSTTGQGFVFDVTIPSQTIQTQGSIQVNGSTGNVSISGGNNVTVSNNAGSIIIHGKTDFPYINTSVSSNFQSTGAYLTTAAQSNHGHSVVVQGNILATSGNGTFTLSVPNQTVQTQNLVSFNGNTGALSLAVGSSLSSSVNGLSTTFGLASNITSVLQSAGNYLTTAALSNHSHGNPTLALTNISGTTASASNGLTISLSAGLGGGASTGTLSAVGNTIATNSVSATHNISNLQFAGSGIASVGVSNGSVIISVPSGGAGGIFPFYKQNGTAVSSDPINLINGSALPFKDSNGIDKNINLVV